MIFYKDWEKKRKKIKEKGLLMLQQANLNATKRRITDAGSVDMRRNNRLSQKKKVTPGAQRTLSKALYPNVCSLTEPSTQQSRPGTPPPPYPHPPLSVARHSVVHQ